LKLATTKTKVTKVRGKLKTIGVPDLRHIHYATKMTPIEWQTVLSKPHHAKRYGRIRFEKRLVGGSVATFFSERGLIFKQK